MKNKIVTLTTCSYSRAELLKARLQSENIACYLKNVNLIQSFIAGGVKVRIHGEDLPEALKVIEELELTYAREKVEQEISKTKVDVNRILVPIDFSDISPRLCEYALDMARKFHADILLFHTYFTSTIETVPFSDSYTYNATVVEVLTEVEKNAKTRIKALYRSLKKRIEEESIEGVEVDFSLSGGSATSEILAMNKRYQPDIIIMGSRGETAGTQNVLGSVVSKVLESTNIPTLILSEQGDYVNLDRVSNIMYATNFDKLDFKAIARLKYLIEPYQMKIHCIHFEENGEEGPWEEHRMEVLRKYSIQTFGKADVTCQVIYMKDKQKGIEKYIQEHDIGVIAILARKHSLLERLFFSKMSRKLFIGTHIPILVFH